VKSDKGLTVEMDIADIIGAERSKCVDVHVKNFIKRTCSNQLISSEAFEYLDLLTCSEDLVFDLTKKLYSKTIFGLTQRTYNHYMTGSSEFAEPPPTTPEDVYNRDKQIRNLLKRYLSQEGKGLFSQDGVSPAKLASGIGQFRSQFEKFSKAATSDASHEYLISWHCYTGVNVELFKNFIGTISTVLASTAVVEGDMSRHKYERTHRESLNEFNIQAGIHCKQWKQLKETSQKLPRLVDSS